MIRLRGGKLLASGCAPRAYSLMSAPRRGDLRGQLMVLPWVDDIHPRTEHRQRAATGFQRRAVRLRIYPARQAADDGHARVRQIGRQHASDFAAIRRGVPRPYHCNRPIVARRQLPAHVKHRRRVIDVQKPRRVLRIFPGEHAHARGLDLPQLGGQVELTARLNHAGDRTTVETDLAQPVGRRMPGRLDRAIGIQQRARSAPGRCPAHG